MQGRCVVIWFCEQKWKQAIRGKAKMSNKLARWRNIRGALVDLNLGDRPGPGFI